MRYYFMVNSWNWEMISCRGKYRLANAASRSPNAQTSLKLSIKRVYQLANQPNQRKKERKKGKQRAHRPLLLGSVPSCAYAPADPTQALLFDVSQRRAAPAGGDSYYGARSAHAGLLIFGTKFLAILSPSLAAQSWPSTVIPEQ